VNRKGIFEAGRSRLIQIGREGRREAKQPLTIGPVILEYKGTKLALTAQPETREKPSGDSINLPHPPRITVLSFATRPPR
jgi:hypothetical protein